MEKKIDIGQKAKVEIEWRVKSPDHTKEEEKSIKTLFAKKYGIPESNITVIPKHTVAKSAKVEGLNSENIKNIQDPLFQQSMFKQYLAENGIEDYDFDAILKIDSQINSLIDYDSYEKGKHYTVKSLSWSNFLSYGDDNHFDFTQLHGLVLLNGQPANKSGKSTFAYDLLHFLFFGGTKSGKAKTLNDLFNNYRTNETEMYVEGCIEIDGVDYIIRRTVTRPAKSKKAVRTASQKIQYYKVLEGGVREELPEEENLQLASSKETSKVIKEAIGNENDFDLIISANAKDLDELISLKEDARGKLLSRWVGLSVLEDKDAKAREKWNKQISVGRFCDVYSREALKNDIASLEESSKECGEIIESDKKKLNESVKRIEDYNKDKELTIASKRPINQEVLKGGDTTTLQAKLENVVEAGKKKRGQIPALEEKIKNFGEIEYSEDEYKSYQKEKEGIIERISSIKAEINAIRNTNSNLSSAEYCPTCKRKLDNVDNSGIIKENEKKIEALIQEGTKLASRKNEIIPLMEAIEVKREQLKEKNKIEIQLSVLNTEIANLRNEYKDIKSILEERKANEEAIKLNDELDAKINVINASIKIEEGLRSDLTREIAQMESVIKKNDTTVGEKKGIIVKIEEETKIEKDWKLYLKMIGKDGISKMVLRSALPIINNELNRLLYDVTDFEINVEINDKKDVDFWLIRDGVKTRLAGASGLERTQAALALRVVLGNMSRLSKPPFILLDEILGTTDKEFYEDMKKLYDKILQNFDFIIHICHLQDWIEYHNQIITVKKENNISSIMTTTL